MDIIDIETFIFHSRFIQAEKSGHFIPFTEFELVETVINSI
ncbi:MAG: hypothetical protein ACOZCL_17915 [Bacillota bacterium]